MDRNRLRAAIVVVVLALAGLVPACSSAQSECTETTWKNQEVEVTRPVELRATHDDEAQVLAEIGVGETLSPTRRYRCPDAPRGERTWLQVEYDGKVGWIKRNHVTFPEPTPTSTR